MSAKGGKLTLRRATADWYLSEMKTVYALWFVREYDHRRDTELLIGVFACEAEAVEVVEALKEKPGFRDYSEGFGIFPYKLGQTGWQEGFVTDIGPPPKDADGEAFDVPAWL
jgi:homoserine kinase type II